MLPPSERNNNRVWYLVGGAAIALVLAVLFYIYAFNGKPSASPGSGGAAAGPIGSVGPSVIPGAVQPPSATPLASPPTAPSGDGTSALIQTTMGAIVFDIYNTSAPVASQNFINLANANFYNGLTFHRIVPGFVIQGGDPKGDGSGGPGYTIPDEPVVGDYTRGIVAMARTSASNSAGSQFFIVLDDSVANSLPKSGDYVIFGKVTTGMDVVDKIAATENSGPPNNTALDPVVMNTVTIQAPGSV